MKILLAPLNWGLGHASRCVPLVQRLLDEGHELVLGGDGESLTLLRRHFPKLRYVYLAPLNLRYSAGKSQVWAMLKALPKLLAWAYKDHLLLRAVLREEPFDRVISDNRFGLYSSSTECIYLTHQLHIMLPKAWQWAEPVASRLHARIYTRYNKVWVPDFEELDKSLAGELSHPTSPISNLQSSIEYIGPLSRFQGLTANASKHTAEYDIVAVLSGLEPQRSLLENAILKRYAEQTERVLLVQGLLHRPNTRIKRGNITLVPYLSDSELATALLSAKHIIARSGYSTIMDLAVLGLLKNNNGQLSIPNSQLEFIPTPGQPEQEYLAKWIVQNDSFL